MDAILTRRSIRKYTKEPVPDGVIEELLEAAMSAPSAGNQQPWHFVAINDRKILDKITEYHPRSEALKEAPTAILVCYDEKLEKHQGFWVQDCSAATENILIAVSARGLGAVWLGVYPREERYKGIRRVLGIPEHVIPFSLIPIGHPAEKKARENRFNPSRIHYNRW